MACTAANLLDRIAAAPPWFPSQSGLPREEYEPLISQMMSARLIEARDWVKGPGQGFALTERGEEARTHPHLLPKMLAQDVVEIEAAAAPTTFDRGERARGSYYDERTPVVTLTLIAINFAVFLIGLIIASRVGSGRMAYINGTDNATLARLGAVNGMNLLQGDWWRLEAATFVHIGIYHLLLNLYGLYLVGNLAERLWGRWRFAIIYLMGGLGGTVLAMILRPGATTAGASGAIWGVMTSLFVWIYQYRQHFEPDTVKEFTRRLFLAIGFNVAFSFLPNVSWQGHLGGAIAGTLAAITLDWIRPGYRRRSRAGVIATALLPVAMIGLLIVAMLYRDNWKPFIGMEAMRQQGQYLAPIRGDLSKIDQQTVHLLVADTANVKNVLMYDKLEARAKLLQANADALLNAIPESASKLAPDMPAKLRAYCEAVRVVAMALQTYHTAEKGDFTPVTDAVKLADERWTSLFHNRWLE